MRTPLNKKMCKTCPFRPGSPTGYVMDDVTATCLTEASHICHNTGGPNLVYPEGTGKPPRLCRGARDTQLQVLHTIGFLPAPTDAAWDAKCAEMGIEPDSVRKQCTSF